MPTFNHTFCDPLKPNVIDLGPIAITKIIPLFNSFPWNKHLKNATDAGKEVYFSPSLEFENTETKQGLTISAIGETTPEEYMIFYKRPKTIKKFGLFNKFNPEFTTELTVTDKQKVIKALEALIHEDSDFLERLIKT